MPALSGLSDLVPLDHGLCVFTTVRRDGGIQASVVNAGVLAHPLTGEEVVGVVAAGGSTKLRNLRADGRCTVVARAGWQWTAVEGTADLVGPDDQNPAVDGERLRMLLREIFQAAGGTHDDWDIYDRTMAAERRTAVLVGPGRVYSNPT